ncbi:MAG: flagellar motor protein MotB [Myxococcota bacterium]
MTEDAEEEGGFDEPTAPAWMATFGDLMSLLLTFFVLLMSFASMDVRRYAAVAGSMRDAFGVQKIHPGQLESLSTSVIELSKQESSPFLEVLPMPVRVPERDQSLEKRLEMSVEEQGLERLVEVESSPRGVVVRVPGQLLFESGGAQLLPEALVFLHEIAGLVRALPNRVSVEGHTDDTPAGGAFATNWGLSSARAVATVRHLIEVGKIEPSRLQATGFADTRPHVPNRGDEERESNRRVEIVFLRPPQISTLQQSETAEPERAEPVGNQPESGKGVSE